MIDQFNNNGMGNPAYANVYQGYQPQQVQKFANTLSQEEIEKLTKATSKFSLSITNEERLRGICNHRTPDGTNVALTPDPTTGLVKCGICGYTFRQASADLTADEIKDVIQGVVDLLQTIKLMFIDMPQESAREFFQIIPLLEKVPELFELAAKNLTKHETYGWNTQNQNMSAYNMFQNLSNIYGNGMMGFNQQPMMNPGMAQPMGAPMGMPQQPMYQQPMMGQPMSNGFMYTGAPAQGYQPQTTGFAYNPSGVAQAVPTTANEAVATVDAVDVTPQETTVQQTIKA